MAGKALEWRGVVGTGKELGGSRLGTVRQGESWFGKARTQEGLGVERLGRAW